MMSILIPASILHTSASPGSVMCFESSMHWMSECSEEQLAPFQYLDTEVCFYKSLWSYDPEYYTRILLFDSHHGKTTETQNILYFFPTM